VKDEEEWLIMKF